MTSNNGIPSSPVSWALTYSGMGWHVFPCHSIEKGQCTCPKGSACSAPGKHPRTASGAKDATTDPALVESWWSRWPDANVAINTGRSELVVVDIDVRKDGFASMSSLPFDLPPTLRARTGGAGQHLVFARPPGEAIHGRNSWLTGVDIKASENDYVIVAPSGHASGADYGWENWGDTVAVAPAELVESLRRPSANGSTSSEESDRSDVIAGLPEGGRDNGLFREACRLRNVLHNDRRSVELLIAEYAARCSPPFAHDEAMRKVDQAFRMPRDEVPPELVEWARTQGRPAGSDLLTAMRSALLTPDDLEALPDPEWLIDGILPKSSMSVLYGQPGLGKTFLALDWALRIGGGGEWFGREVQTGTVLYVYAEGVYGLKNRRAAWVQSTGLLGPLDVRFFPRAVPLLDDAWVSALTDLCRELRPSLVVFDTLARATAGGDENSAKDMGRAVAACDAVRDATGSAVMLVHHTGKDGLNYRGSSAIEGAADTMLHLVRMDSGYLELRCAKQKEAEQFDPIPLQLESTGPSAVIAAAPSVAGFVETQATSQLLAILNAHKETWLATASIADEAGIKVKKTAQRRLDQLWEGGLIDRRDTGKGYQYRAKWTP